MALVGYRGITPLEEDDELKAHLAVLLRLENVGLLLGAGASCPVGGRTVRQLWDDFVVQSPDSAQWLIDQKFLSEIAVADGPERIVPNVEELVDQLEVAIQEWTRTEAPALMQARAVRANLFRAVVRAALLDRTWWQSPAGVAADAAPFEHHRAILQKLLAARQPGQAAPWIFTTNYDLAIEWAAESIDVQVVNGFLGVHSRRFSPHSFDLGFRNVQARGEARFGAYNIYLSKLHGSLTWSVENDQLFEIPAPLAWQRLQQFLDTAGETELGFMVLPRAAKYLQTVGFTLGELLRRFSEFLARPQTTLLVCGYAFGDEHINRLLLSALLNPTLQLVVYLPEFTGDIYDEALPPAARRLLALRNPRITMIGGDERAWLDRLAADLPDPVLYDDETHRLRAVLKDRNLQVVAPVGNPEDGE